MNLTPKQKEAVESWECGDVCVVAGPGSGKTTVLVERFRWLAEEEGVSPEKILAVTFTEKAAAQMQQRLMEEAADPGRLASYQRAQISTIHAFCARLLREHALEAGLDPEFRVLDEWEAGRLLREAVSRGIEAKYREDPAAARRFLRAYAGARLANDELHPTNIHEEVFGLYQRMQSWGEKPFLKPEDAEAAYRDFWDALNESAGQALELAAFTEVARAAAGPPWGEAQLELLARVEEALPDGQSGPGRRREVKRLKELLPYCRSALLAAHHQGCREWLKDLLERVDRDCRKAKREAGALDFADLEEQTVRLLEDSDPLARYEHVLVDEYQDTNPLQARLIAAVCRGGAVRFGVGDINQSIYGFRHARPEVFDDYRKTVKNKGGHVVELLENFRSRPEILQAVGAVTNGVQGIEKHELSCGIEQKFEAKQEPSLEVHVIAAAGGRSPSDCEAEYVAGRIAELHGTLRFRDRGARGNRAARWSDFAILVRTNKMTGDFVKHLARSQIPFQVSSGSDFFNSEAVRDILRLVRVMRNPRDEVSLAAVLRSPLVGVSDDTLLAMKFSAEPAEQGEQNQGRETEGAEPQEKPRTVHLAGALRRPPGLEPEERGRVERFRDLLDRFRGMREDAPAELLLARLLAETGYERWLAGRPNGAQDIANLRKLLMLVRRLSGGGESGFDAVAERLEMIAASPPKEAEAPLIEEELDAVHVMTLHAAKGLEFPVVVIPSLNKGGKHSSDPLLYSPEHGIGARWIDPVQARETGSVDKAKAGDPAYEAVRAENETRDEEEDGRLLYVGMTRAEHHLLLGASFRKQGRRDHWAKLLNDNLGISLKKMVKHGLQEPEERNVSGCRFRLATGLEEQPEVAAVSQERDGGSETIWIEPAAAADPADSVASVTAVTLFQECPRRYYLSRYLGFGGQRKAGAQGFDEEGGEEDADAPDASELGRRVHAVLAGSEPEGEAGAEVQRLAQSFRNNSLGRRAAAAANALHEQNLIFPAAGRLLRGQVDLFFDEGGERVLVDYKTDNVSAEETAERATAYALQLQLYARAIENLDGRRPDRAVLYFLRPDRAVEVDVSDEALAVAESKVEEFFAAQTNQSFPLRVGRHCFHCEHYRGLCPARVPVEQTRKAATR